MMKNTKLHLILALGFLLAHVFIPAPVFAESSQESTAIEDSRDSDTVTPETIAYASSWEEIYETLTDIEEIYYYGYDDWTSEDWEADASASAGPMNEDTSFTAKSLTSSTEYSETNLRDADVDEADIVKTDGSYIYILQEDQYLTIVKADENESTVISRTPIYPQDYEASSLLPENEQVTRSAPAEMFLSGDRMILILKETQKSKNEYSWKSNDYTRVVTLDLSDPSAPTVLGEFSQEGLYAQARRINDITYLYTTMTPDIRSTLDDSDLSVSINEQPLSPECFCIPKLAVSRSYLVCSSMKEENPNAVQDAVVFVSGGEQFYVSDSSLYILNSFWNRSKSQTQITRFAQTDGQLEGIASCTVNGYVNDTWSIDEYQGNLRVLLTYYSIDVADFLSNLLSGDTISDAYDYSLQNRMNALFVLDENLQKISRIGGIAKNEEIRSARFLGETAYFVTYQNTDPLFRADLSNPEQPLLLDSLEITGFSSYLHPFGTDRLLGIGYETDPDTGKTLGLKFTMFDTSLPDGLTVIQTMVVPGIVNCPAVNNYKSIFVSPEKGLFGFYYSDRYLLYSYQEEGGFAAESVYDLLPIGLAGSSDSSSMRGLYIDDEFYLAGDTYVIGFSLAGESDKEFVLYT